MAQTNSPPISRILLGARQGGLAHRQLHRGAIEAVVAAGYTPSAGIVATPAAGSMHMLRYTVLLNGKRLGALLSVPTESDCRFLEAPPKVPAERFVLHWGTKPMSFTSLPYLS